MNASQAGFEGGTACPHCGGITTTEAHAALRWVCGACGGPRVVGVPAAMLTQDAVHALKRAQNERAASVLGETGRIVAIVGTLMTWAIALLALWAHAPLAAFIVAIVGGVAAAASMALGRVARTGARASREALDEGWAEVAKHLLEARGGAMTAPEIAHAMRLTEADAERVLAQLSAHGAHVRVGDDAELAYDVDSASDADARRAQR